MERNYDKTTKMRGGFPAIRKLGAVSPNCESSPFTWDFGDGERLMRLELVDRSIQTSCAEPSFAIIRDGESGRVLSSVGEGCYYFSFYKENDTAYVLGTKSFPGVTAGDEIMIFESRDLIHWTGRSLLKRPGWVYFNTSLTRDETGYVLALEAGEPKEAVGPYVFTVFFARSPDMANWMYLPDTLGFPKDRYAGGPFLRYSRGWYYLILVTELPCQRYTSYIYRTKDFADWEVGLYNPMMMADERDRIIAPFAADIDGEKRKAIQEGFLSSVSDHDICDFQGKTVITYNTGNQLGFCFICQAEYDGPSDDFLEAWFR